MPCEGDGERSDREEVSPPRKVSFVSLERVMMVDGLRVSFFLSFPHTRRANNSLWCEKKKTDVETSPLAVVEFSVKKRILNFPLNASSPLLPLAPLAHPFVPEEVSPFFFRFATP